MADITLRRRLSEPTFALNIALRGVADQSFTESVIADVFWRWEDEPAMEPQFLATTTAGKTLQVPFDLKGRSIRLFLTGRTSEGFSSVREVTEGDQVVVTPGATPEEEIAATIPVVLFDHYNDATTLTDDGDIGGALWESLYSGDLAVDRLASDGEEVRADYHGSFAANANQKELRVSFAGTGLTTVTTEQLAGHWDLRVTLMRIDSDSVRWSATFVGSDDTIVATGQLDSLNFGSALNLLLEGRTEIADGDLTAKKAKVIWWPAASAFAPEPEGENVLEFGADMLEFGTDNLLEFTP